MAISYALMHVPERPQLLPLLAAEFPHLLVVTDHEHAGVWATARVAWLAALETGAEHVMVLQDDMLPTSGAAAEIQRWCDELPGAVHAAFQPHRPDWADVYHAEQRRQLLSACVQGGTVVLPRELAAAWLAWAPETSHCYDDDLLSAWLRQHHVLVHHHYPPLLRHVGWDRSTIGSPAERWREGIGLG